MGGKYGSVGEGFRAARIDGARYHLFLCLGPDCAPMERGETVWKSLKEMCAELRLPVMRTKAACLRVCTDGPWLVVYPDGVWYGKITPERCARILREHIGEGLPVAEWAVKTHPLCGAGGPR